MRSLLYSAVFLQVRLHSSRLPGKALMFLGKKPLTQWCLESLEPLKTDLKVLVTEPASAEALLPLTQKSGWGMFVGSTHDVLDRFIQAAHQYGVGTIVRATGDNPFVSARLANRLLELHLAARADYSCFQGGPLGSGVEISKTKALQRAWEAFPSAEEKEHVCPYLYRRPEQFRLHYPQVPQVYHYPQGRITVDTLSDLCYLRALWKDFGQTNLIDLEHLIPWLKNHPHPNA